MVKRLSYTVILEKETDPEFKGYYNASVPALPGCFSYGATKQAALKNIKEAIACYLEDLQLHNEPIPDDMPPSIEKVGVAL
jgi:antitoxin HicB